jgi:hypothetical protein
MSEYAVSMKPWVLQKSLATRTKQAAPEALKIAFKGHSFLYPKRPKKSNLKDCFLGYSPSKIANFRSHNMSEYAVSMKPWVLQKRLATRTKQAAPEALKIAFKGHSFLYPKRPKKSNLKDCFLGYSPSKIANFRLQNMQDAVSIISLDLKKRLVTCTKIMGPHKFIPLLIFKIKTWKPTVMHLSP